MESLEQSEQQEQPAGKIPYNFLSKKGYIDLEDKYTAFIKDEAQVKELMTIFRQVFNFDPNKKLYSDYHKEYYKNNKDTLNKKRNEARKKKQLLR